MTRFIKRTKRIATFSKRDTLCIILNESILPTLVVAAIFIIVVIIFFF